MWMHSPKVWIHIPKAWIDILKIWIETLKVWFYSEELWLAIRKVWIQKLKVWINVLNVWIPIHKVWIKIPNVWMTFPTCKSRHPQVFFITGFRCNQSATPTTAPMLFGTCKTSAGRRQRTCEKFYHRTIMYLPIPKFSNSTFLILKSPRDASFVSMPTTKAIC